MEDIQPQEGAREFGLSSWSVTNRTTVFVLMAIIIISGHSYILPFRRRVSPRW